MNPADQYLKFVEWDSEDQIYVGRCPALFAGGIHGDDDRTVYAELYDVVDEWIDILASEGLDYPVGDAQLKYSGKFVLRVGEALHRELSISTRSKRESLNGFCVRLLKKALVNDRTASKKADMPRLTLEQVRKRAQKSKPTLK